MKQFKVGDKVKINPVWEGLPRAGTGVVTWVTREREFTPEHIAMTAYGDAYTPARCRPIPHPKYFVRRDNPRDPEYPFLITVSTLPLELISEVEINTGTNMSTIQLSVGEWKMRNGEKATILGKQQEAEFPWIGFHKNSGNLSAAAPRWRSDGSYARRDHSGYVPEDPLDIIAPWTPPIAPGHNPDKLTVERVGDGWFTHEWELLEKVSPELKMKHFEVWFDGKWWNAPFRKDTGPENFSTYRTRLTREELLKLIAPKKRLLRVEELPAVCWVGAKGVDSWDKLVLGRSKKYQSVGVWVLGDFSIKELFEQDYKWSSDLKTWHSFEVEEKE